MNQDPASSVQMGTGAGKLSPFVFCEVFVRSFFVQALWNFQRGWNFGWFFCFWPVLRRLFPEREARARAALDHLEFFSTHPYFLNLVLGVSAGLEEDFLGVRDMQRDNLSAVKKRMSGPLAALGESFFWAAVRPLLAVCAVAAGFFAVKQSWWLVPIIFLVSFNTLHLLIKAGGLAAGYKWKSQVVGYLMKLDLQKIIQGMFLLGLGVCLGGVLVQWLASGAERAVLAGFLIVAFLMLRLRISATTFFCLMVALLTGYRLI